MVVTALALLSAATVMANVQGSVSPFASLVPIVTDGPAGDVLDQIRQRPSAGQSTPPALEFMIGDFGRYHLAMVFIAATTAVAFLAAGIVLGRRFAAARDGRAKRVLASLGGLAVSLSLATGLLAVANVTVATDPAPAFLALFQGSW